MEGTTAVSIETPEKPLESRMEAYLREVREYRRLEAKDAQKRKEARKRQKNARKLNRRK